MKSFPVYKTHAESVDAQCFNCGDWFDKLLGQPSGYSQGKFFSQCCKCGMKTFYDLEAADADRKAA